MQDIRLHVQHGMQPRLLNPTDSNQYIWIGMVLDIQVRTTVTSLINHPHMSEGVLRPSQDFASHLNGTTQLSYWAKSTTLSTSSAIEDPISNYWTSYPMIHKHVYSSSAYSLYDHKYSCMLSLELY